MSRFLGWCAVVVAAPILGLVVIFCFILFIGALLLEALMNREPDFSWWNKGVCKRVDGAQR